MGPILTEARLGIYRYDGLGGWHQTATVRQPEELKRLNAALNPAIENSAPAFKLAVD